MSRNRLHRSVEVDGKTVEYAINRRGCKGRWTKKDDEMMAQLIKAVHRSEKQKAQRKCSGFASSSGLEEVCRLCAMRRSEHPHGHCYGFQPSNAFVSGPINDTSASSQPTTSTDNAGTT